MQTKIEIKIIKNVSKLTEESIIRKAISELSQNEIQKIMAEHIKNNIIEEFELVESDVVSVNVRLEDNDE